MFLIKLWGKIKKMSKKKKELMKDLEELPGLIRSAEKDIRKYSMNISTMEKDMETINNAVLTAISKETIEVTEPVPITKKKFPNEIIRSYELNKRLRIHKEHRELLVSSNFSQKQFEDRKIDLNFLLNRFSATKYMIRLICGRDD